MTIDDGAGVYERQEDWTFDSVFEDWAATKKLSRRKLAWLEAEIRDFIDFFDRDLYEPFFPAEVDPWVKIELDQLKLKYKVQCMAHLLDTLKPKLAGISRLEKTTAFLKRKGYLK